MSDIDALLDSTLDDLEDLPEFKPFTPGAHKVLATMELKEINGRDAVELSFTLIETLEYANPSDETENPTKEGDTANTMFLLDNEYGLGNLKKCAIPFGEAMGLSKIRDIVEQVTDVECVVATSTRQDKKDPDRLYLQVKELQVV